MAVSCGNFFGMRHYMLDSDSAGCVNASVGSHTETQINKRGPTETQHGPSYLFFKRVKLAGDLSFPLCTPHFLPSPPLFPPYLLLISSLFTSYFLLIYFLFPPYFLFISSSSSCPPYLLLSISSSLSPDSLCIHPLFAHCLLLNF